MSKTPLSIIISYGQSLSVGAESLGAISTTALYPENALMFDYIDAQKRYSDWGSRGPGKENFNVSDVAGFTSLKNFTWESHTAAMINTVLQRYDDAGKQKPVILNISAGRSGASIEELSDKDGTPYKNIIMQIGAAISIAESSGYEIDTNFGFYWKQGASNSGDFHIDYANKLSALANSVTEDISGLMKKSINLEVYVDVDGYRGSAWGNLDYAITRENAYLAAELQKDYGGTEAEGFISTLGAHGGHQSSAAYYMQGTEAGHKIADVRLGSETFGGAILVEAAKLISPREIVLQFSGLKSGLFVDETHYLYFRHNNSIDLGLFAYKDAGLYTGGHASSNQVAAAKIISFNQLLVTMESDIISPFFLGIAGGDGEVILRGTPIRDGKTVTINNPFENSDIEEFNKLGGIKKFVPYQYVKIGPEGLLADAIEIAGGRPTPLISINIDVVAPPTPNESEGIPGPDVEPGPAPELQPEPEPEPAPEIAAPNFAAGETLLLDGFPPGYFAGLPGLIAPGVSDGSAIVVASWSDLGALAGLAGVTLAAAPDGTLRFDFAGVDGSTGLVVAGLTPVAASHFAAAAANGSLPAPNDADQSIRTYGADDLVLAGGGRDQVRAGAGDDFIDGGAGDDTLVGGAGSDTLFGGAGRDRFVLSAKEMNAGDRDILADLDFTGGDTLYFGGFAAGTYASRQDGGGAALIRTTADLANLNALSDFSFETSSSGALVLRIETAGGPAFVELWLDDASAARADALIFG